MRRSAAVALALLIAAWARPGLAAERGPVCAPLDDLRAGAVPQAMRVAPGAGRLHFMRGAEAGTGCPGPAAACAARAYLVSGDRAIVTRTRGGFACAAFLGGPPRFAATTGWLPREGLRAALPAAPHPAAWAGDWHGLAALLAIRPAARGRIALRGTAGSGGARAEVAVTVAPVGNAAGFATDAAGVLLAASRTEASAPGCALRIWWFGTVLAAADNGRCGSFGAGFTGFYHRGGAGATRP